MTERWTLLRGDCFEVLKGIADNSIDACVTDPPYGLSEHTDIQQMVRHWFVGKPFVNKSAGFMGKEWDSFVPGPEIWREVKRVLKPGGYLLAFSGSRTVDLMGIAIRFAGFEMRDTILCWCYGSGFPKSLNVSKALDKSAGLLEHEGHGMAGGERGLTYTPTIDPREYVPPEPVSDAAKQWRGWGTALKPAFEPVLVARKPLEGSIVENVPVWGVGALNIDGCRVETDDDVSTHANGKGNTGDNGVYGHYAKVTPGKTAGQALGRWPPNILLTHHPECVEDGACHVECGMKLLDEQSGILAGGHAGGASRFYPQFYYHAKAGRAERDQGLDEFEVASGGAATGRKDDSAGLSSPRAGAGRTGGSKNIHPTVKPVDVMRWLIKLVVPDGGLVLDPFNGSGTTGVAAMHEGARYVGIEREPQYADIAEARLRHAAETTEAKPPFVPVPTSALSTPQTTAVAPPSSDALRRAFDITEEVTVERKPGSLAPKDFKRLVAKSMKR